MNAHPTGSAEQVFNRWIAFSAVLLGASVVAYYMAARKLP